MESFVSQYNRLTDRRPASDDVEFQETGFGFDLHDLKGIVERRFWHVILPVLFLLPITIAIAVLWPPVYRSEALIIIDQPNVPTALIDTTVTSYVDQRIQIIEQRFLATDNLLKLIEKYDLYPEERESLPDHVVAEKMRGAVSVDLLTAGSRRSAQTIAFTVAFEYHEPEPTQLIAEEITKWYLQENATARQKQAEEASEFVAGQISILEKEIAELEKKLAEFKEKYDGSLPGQRSDNISQIRSLEAQIAELALRADTLEARKRSLQSEISLVVPYGPYVIGDERVRSPDEQLKALQLQWLELSSRLTPRHPRMITLKSNIEMLRAQIQNRGSATGQRSDPLAAETQPPGSPIVSPRPDNPQYIRLSDQIKALDIELDAIARDRQFREARKARLEERLIVTGTIEEEYSGLVRAHQGALDDFQALRRKELTAELGEALESVEKGERFTVLEPAVVPTSKERPKRGMIVLVGLALSVGAGLGIAVLAELLDSTLYSSKKITEIAGEPPLVLVPYIKTRADIRRTWRQRAIISSLFVIMIAGGLVYVDQRVKPLSEYQELAANLIDENIEHLGISWSRSGQSPTVIKNNDDANEGDATAFESPLTVTTLIDTPVALDLAGRMLGVDNRGAEKEWAIDDFTRPVHGSLGKDENGQLIYTPAPGFVGTDHLNYMMRDNSERVRAQVTVHVVPPKTFDSDDFGGSTLEPKWSLVGDAGEAQTQAENRERFLRLIVPDGGDYNAWKTNNTVRLMQSVALKTDFAVEARFLSLPEQQYQMQGILIEQDPDTWLRFDIYKDVGGFKIFSAMTQNGTSSVKFRSGIEPDRARYLRVARSGDEWTFAHSADGASWVTAGTFTQPLNIVTAVGIFAGATRGADGHTVLVDYFVNAASPLEFEDGVPNLSIEPAARAQDEGNTGTTPLELVVSRKNSKDAIGGTTVVDYVVTGGGSTPTDENDFVGGAWPKGRIAFFGNDETQTITIPVSGDADFEGDETFTVTLMNASNGRVVDATATATILNDDPMPPPPSVKSDDFSSSQLSPFWLFHGPGGWAKVVHSGEDHYLSIAVPEGGNYEAWDANNAPRVVQRVANEDFRVKAKFISKPMTRFQMQGILIEGNPENWLRFDVHFDGRDTRIFGALTANGLSVEKFNKAIVAENAVYLRAVRSGDTWTFEYSGDGVSWSAAGRYDASLTVTAVGLFAGATSGAPGFEAQVDLFEYSSGQVARHDDQPSDPVPANN